MMAMFTRNKKGTQEITTAATAAQQKEESMIKDVAPHHIPQAEPDENKLDARQRTLDHLNEGGGRDVATTGDDGDALPDFLNEEIAKDTGKGLSTDRADNIVPLLYVLDAKSPQVNKRNENYVEGAEAGDIWLRGTGIIKGMVGTVFQPCHFSKDWVEWVPRDDGGGLVGRYAERPKEAIEEHDADNPNIVRYKMPNGNELKETRYHVGIVYTKVNVVRGRLVIEEGCRILPYVLPLTGTGHTVSRQLMFMMNSKTMPNGDRIPSFAFMYKLKTKARKNKKGEWFLADFSDLGPVPSRVEYTRGRELHEDFTRGDKVIEEEVVTNSGDGDDETL